jgi:DNA-binding NarL/FixJ family response regulator
VIVVTSSSAEADRLATQRLGANAYFEKPADLASYRELAEVIRKVLAVVNWLTPFRGIRYDFKFCARDL